MAVPARSITALMAVKIRKARYMANERKMVTLELTK